MVAPNNRMPLKHAREAFISQEYTDARWEAVS